MPESVYPVGHPTHLEYKGELWHNPADRSTAAYYPNDAGYPAPPADLTNTPDGKRAAINARQNNLSDLAAMGCLPPLVDPQTNEPVPLTPAQLTYVYTVRNSIRQQALADIVTERYGLAAKPVDPAKAAAVLTNDDIAFGFLLSLRYSPEKARQILEKYGTPDIVAEKLQAERV